MSSKIIAFTSLLALAAALPSGYSTPRIAVREASEEHVNTECWKTDPGTTFYRCGEHVGCFWDDPCTESSESPATPVVADPAVPSPSTTKKPEILVSKSYNIYPNNPDGDTDAVPHVDLAWTPTGGIITTNVLVFDDIPDNAKLCTLMWRSEKVNVKSSFYVEGNGQASTRVLLGMPTGKINHNSIEEFRDCDKDFSQGLDFTGWESSPGEHTSTTVECKKQIAFEIEGSDRKPPTGGNRVFIENSKTNGFYMTYTV